MGRNRIFGHSGKFTQKFMIIIKLFIAIKCVIIHSINTVINEIKF